MESSSANEEARSLEGVVVTEAELSADWTRIERELFHWKSPEPVLDTDRRRIGTSRVRAGMS